MNVYVVVIDKLVGSGKSSTPQIHHVPSDDIDAVKVFLKVIGEPKDNDTIVRVYKTSGSYLHEVDLDPKQEKLYEFNVTCDPVSAKNDHNIFLWSREYAKAIQRKTEEIAKKTFRLTV